MQQPAKTGGAPPARAFIKGHAPTVMITDNKGKIVSKHEPPPETPPEGPRLIAQTSITGKQVRKLLGITDEQQKYMKCWNLPAYRNHSPGERTVDMFLECDIELSDAEGNPSTLIDWGCGTGRGGYKLWRRGFDVTLLDFAPNCLDENIAAVASIDDGTLRFLEHSLIDKLDYHADYGYCCDVMEHLPPDEVDAALAVILENSTHCFFQISTMQDHFGSHEDINEPLHLSVHGYQWWLKKFVSHGVRIHRSMERPGQVIFFVSGYTGFSFDKLQHNTDIEGIHANMRANAELGLQNIVPGETRTAEKGDEVKLLVLGGGPSLNDHLEEIREKWDNGAGAKIVTMNNTYNWALEHDLIPSLQLMIDAREFNNKFVTPVVEGCKYVIASQCHPSILKSLPKELTYLWQVTLGTETLQVVKELWGDMYDGWYPCPGGCSVMNRGLPLIQMLGFNDVEIYGFDSCNRSGEHHAYEQAENNIPEHMNITFEVEGREFTCQPWMMAQAKEFIDMRHRLLGRLAIKVHGDGMIAHLLETGADVLEE